MTKTAKTRWPRQTTMENLETYGYATQQGRKYYHQ